ncbi:MAG: family 20 glycosylhydrolase [Candidatus Hydrogenedentales bacterium]|jgi:hypothetical protein
MGVGMRWFWKWVLLVVVASCFVGVGANAESWRGVHVMAWGPAGGDEGLPVLKRAIDEVLVPLGMNVLVYEVGYNFEFESHPDMRFDKAMTKAAARDLAQFCREREIRLIPQFNCLGHQSWVKGNMIFPLMANHPEFEEVPDFPEEKRAKTLKNWCPSNPDVYPIVYDLLDELADTFQSDAIHVGMDEVLVFASPKCPRCAGKNPAELFAKAVNDLHKHIVGQRKLTMLMWGDRLLDKADKNSGDGWEASDKGTAPAIDLIPKDIIVCDWHYSMQTDYPSVRLFQEKGFRVWPASWKDSKAALAYVECAHREPSEKMLGYLATSWVIRSGDFAQALLGEGDPEALKDRAQPAADSAKACLKWMQENGK